MLSVYFFILFTLSLAWGQAEVYNLKANKVIPRSDKVFTQGIYFQNGELYESSGKYGQSFIQKGKILNTGAFEVTSKLNLPKHIFAEGMSECGGMQWLLTWKSGQVYSFHPKMTGIIPQFKIQGEGWGLSCYNEQLLLTNGSPYIQILQPGSGQVVHQFVVESNGFQFDKLNEMEVIGDYILVNRWYETDVLVVDLKSQKLVEIWKAHEFPKLFKGQNIVDSMNGIAWDPQTKKLWMTGKYWPGYIDVQVPKESVIWQYVKP